MKDQVYSDTAFSSPSLARRREDGPCSLSFSQQRLWFLNQFEPDSPVYNVAKAVRWQGTLNMVALQNALNAMVARHEILRTNIALVDGNPVQVIRGAQPVNLPVVDFPGGSYDDAELQHFLQTEARRPFNLSSDLMLRATLMRLAENDHVLLAVIHHIACDGWSMDIFFRELGVLYGAFRENSPSPLPDLAIQYSDFAVWQRQWLQGKALQTQLSYWKRQLSALPVLELPTDRPRPPVQTFRGARESLVLPKTLSDELKTLSVKERVTLFMTLVAAFQTLLHRYTGEEDVGLGVPIANRTRREVETLIGFFVNTLIVRSDLSGNPSFRELLARVRSAAMDAYEHQDLPFEKLVEELNPDRDLSRSPLFQVMLVLQNTPRHPLQLPGLTSRFMDVDTGTSKFDLTLSIVQEPQSLIACMNYSTDLFEASTINRMLLHYQTLLESIVANPARQLSDLPILTESEKGKILGEWNDTRRDYPNDLSIHGLFEVQAERSPEAIAVIFEGKQLTYRDLSRQANQLAHYLRALGVGPEVPVGICAERSLELVVGLLGILKAGGAYVPLDPKYPKERLAFMLHDSQAKVLLTQQHLIKTLPELQVEVVSLDADWAVIGQKSDSEPASRVSPKNLAYVIYTSGSTGKPKGVAIEHRSTVTFLHWVREIFSQEDIAGVLFSTSICFDLSIFELFFPLSWGGRVIVADNALHLSTLPAANQVTLINTVPSAMTELLRMGAVPVSVRTVCLAGEPLTNPLVQQIYQQPMIQRVFDLYGPSEDTTYSTFALRTDGGPATIGRPIANTQIYLLDSHLQPVPVGVSGELHIGGGGLARGYIHQPEITAEKFIPNPFGNEPGARLYKTGDLARYLPDGNIEFLGRADHQVKIRGFRVELGEIESILSQHPALRETVVMVQQDTSGDKRLAAYVVPFRPQAPTAGELRAFLNTRLPEYMVPSAFVFLDSLPRTPNGKVDRRALPAPDKSRPELKEAFVASRIPVEEVLAKIWAEVLKIEKVGIYDNFFELGGHSLLAIQVISRLRGTFQVELPLHSLFEAPTIASLAKCVEVALQAEQGLRVTPRLQRVSRDGLPLSFAQQRLWFLDELEPGSPLYNIPTSYRVSGPLNIIALQESLNEIVRRHEVLRTSFYNLQGQPIQTIAPTLSLTLPVVDLSSLPEAERELEALRLAAEETRRSFDLAQAPLLRASVLRLADEEHILLLTLHHIVSDGWSMGVLFQELSALYDAFSTGKASPLSELPIQYADFAVWQRQWLQGEVLENQLSYWKSQLADAPAALELPTDRPRPPVQTFHGARQSVVLSQALTNGLKALSNQESVTLFMTLLAAFQILLHRYTGRDDILVGSPIAGRKRTEIEDLIGFFVNTLVLRTDLSGDPSFRELLGRVRKVALEAHANQDLPFEKLVEELQPERNLSHSPMFQVMFVLQNAPMTALKLTGLTAGPLEIDGGTTKFDLTLSMIEEEGLRGSLAYNTDLFDADTISRMSEHFQTLLKGIVADPAKPVSHLPILTDREQCQLLAEWNDTSVNYSQDKCIHELFEAQVERSPDAVAVVFEDKELTYRELNERANQLAHYLRRLGVGPEVLVGICAERSLDMVIEVLGVLKAGGAYVPLDPGYPKERLAFMLEDSQAKVLLSQQRLVKELFTDSGSKPVLSQVEGPVLSQAEGIENSDPRSSFLNPQLKVICLDTDWEIIARESEENPVGKARPEHLAYVIYTSGSTGRPKGVLIEHQQILNYVKAIWDRLSLERGATFAMVQPLSFDSSQTVIFPSLISGGCLHVISEDKAFDPQGLSECFCRFPIDLLKITPSHLAALQMLSQPEQILPRRWLVMGGEASRPDWVEKLQAIAGCSIFNHYGPTEATVGILTYQVQTQTSHSSSTIPIGRPLSNTQAYLLDRHLQPVPIGVPGELHIGGRCLARGYLNRADLTAEKFIPSPFSDEPDARLYKTGDLARYLPNGNIEFLGRIDHQVKVRGFRIELGEIEAVLRQHPGVRETVVVASEDTLGHQQLITYVVPSPKHAPTIAGRPRYQLPNKLAVAHLHKNETDYLYSEIFDRQAYLRHGITINDGDRVFDVGANIGLFMLFANQISKDAKIYAFEPNPAVFEILSANASLYGPKAKLFKCGLSNEAKTAPFTFFPGFSLLSGFYASPEAEKQLVKTFLTNQQRAGLSGIAELLEQADDILDKRFSPQTFTAQLRTLSGIIEEDKIEAIDLLKINVEKSELDVLLGIKNEDWKKIKQIVLEVDVKENLDKIVWLLERHGYDYVVEQDVLLENTELRYIYAIRPSRERTIIREQAEGTHIRPVAVHNDALLSVGELKSFLSQKLPEYMVPSNFVFLEALPLTSNGKVDRRALPAPDRARRELTVTFVAPRTQTEEVLARIWAEVLKLERVGIHDNFFDLGGHSLLAAQVVSRLREAFHEEIPLRSLFEVPTVAGLAERIEAARQELPNLASSPILPLPCEREWPLSFSQQRLWFLNQLEPNSFVYNITRGFHLTGSLNVKALEQTLGEIVRRHEALRTTFSMRNGEPVQVVAEHWSVKLPIIDLRERPDADLNPEVQRLFDNEFRHPFNLSSGLLVRAALLRLNDKEHVLFLTIHHIAFDHWSIEVLYRELSLVYKAFSAGKVSTLPEPPIQYKHYAIWQRKMLQDAALENHLAYWKQQLSDSPPVLQLPTDQPRPPVQTFRGARLGLVVPKPLAVALKALSREAGVTLFMTLLAAFKILLHRLAGQDDIVVGSPIAGRDQSETEDLIGLFLNTLVLRTKLSGNPTFRELLTRVRDVALGAYDHRDLPFEKLVEELKPKRDLSHTPLFQVFFNMYNFKEPKLDLDGLSVRQLDLSEPISMFDVTLYVRERDDGTHLSLLYNADLFHPHTASRMLGHFETLLQGIVANPDQRLSSLSILTDAEKQQQLLVKWNDTEKDYSENQCIHQLFEAQVEQSPDSVAVLFDGEKLSYRELNRRANQLAHYLRKLGVGPEVPVGLCMERSLEMVVGLLGILKAGGAYVPLDPEYPKARLAYMLADAQADFLLAKERLLENFPKFKGQALCLDRDRGLFEREQQENPDTTLEPDNLAYVIYTSGSTGNPKGVLGYHRAVLNYLSYLRETYNLNGTDIVLQLPSLSFDASVRDIIGPLTAGARLIIVNDFDAKQPAALLSKIKEHGVTCLLSIVPTLLNGLLEAGRSGSGFYNSIRLILVSGEALTTSTCEKTKEFFPSTLLVNQYGPTECTMTSTYHPVIEAQSNYITPLGSPIPNARIYILDNHLRSQPIGIPGEIYIGGVGLARGYMDSPELTAERFIPDPFRTVPGARLYKTGDLARYRNDGNVEFLGRIDHQVKVRGFRIELGEIEAVLTQHPAVQQAVAVVREDIIPGDNRLVAYIVLNKDEAPATDDLRNFLKSKLPEYMIPLAFVVLDAFPLTPNRKVDRRALPAPERSRPELESRRVPPRNPVEQHLADIWAEVLKLEQVGIHDNFFELGGHSLLATQVISRVRDALQLEVPLRALFENPTVASLAAQIEPAPSMER